ncbi:hypothetical protein Lalb_Chr23g0271521 [Lupinus albus]|uniref:Uncharacterized protein n=1 Tax=Lupinus albus TaxID=3870 RepID=A0A6A4NKR5_LUPAL|nr:hypothetical protein Lalb_Chr23g0271521 [Lupinus albus]
MQKEILQVLLHISHQQLIHLGSTGHKISMCQYSMMPIFRLCAKVCHFYEGMRGFSQFRYCRFFQNNLPLFAKRGLGKCC